MSPTEVLAVAEGPDRWDASFYHRVMAQQQLVAAKGLFPIMADVRDGVIVDAGCGSGLVAESILSEFPQAHLFALDLSPEMLTLAQRRLQPQFGSRVSFVQADLQAFVATQAADCIFSNATLHWVRDHHRMFAHFFATLRPGGLIASQFARCGPHTAGIMARVRDFARRHGLQSCFTDWRWCVELVNEPRENEALEQAGFAEIEMTVDDQVFHFATDREHRVFMTKVAMREILARLPDDAARERLMDEVITHIQGEIGRCKQLYESLRCIAHRARVV